MSVYRFTECHDNTRATKEYWDNRCNTLWNSQFHGHFLDDPKIIEQMDEVNQLEITRILTKIIERKPMGGKVRVLECACGVGRYSTFIRQLCDEYVGIDFADRNIKEAKSLYQDDKVKFYMSDMDNYKSEEKFDFIFMVSAWSSIEQKSQEVIDNLKTMLAPGGVIAVFEQNEYFVKWRG